MTNATPTPQKPIKKDRRKHRRGGRPGSGRPAQRPPRKNHEFVGRWADTTPAELLESCERCEKVKAICICTQIRPQKNRIPVVILQHPQEPDKILGTARIAQLTLQNAHLAVGLSWPNLKKAIEKANPASGPELNPVSSEWVVVYLGSGIKATPENHSAFKKASSEKPPSHSVVNAAGDILPDLTPAQISGIRGIVVLDGTWSQAKTLWWRNPWLLKLKRFVLHPKKSSLYQELRKEPKRQCISTLESIGLTLTSLGENGGIENELLRTFELQLQAIRQASASASRSSAKPAPTEDLV